MGLMGIIARNFRDMKLWGKNAKVIVATEALWGIPMSWVFFYQVIFMRTLGMSEVFIGLSVMLPLIFQAFLPILGGHLADEFGRKRTLMLFDSIGWIGAMATWSIAKEPWHIIVAVLFQGLATTIFGVWETILVEDTELPYRVGIYSLIQLTYIIGGILTPIAGALVSLFGVEQGCRFLFLTSLITIAVMLVIRQIYLKESKMGRLLASPNKAAFSRSESYRTTLRTIIQHKKLVTLFVLTTIGSVQVPLMNTYKPLYLTDPKALALDESIVSVVPLASSIPSLIALSLIVPRLKHTHLKKALLFSYLCGFLGVISLIMAPRGSLALAIFSAVLDSARFVAVFSILRVLFVNTIDEINPLARAKIMSLITTFSALSSWPVPLIGGYLYAASPALPFVLAGIFLILSICLMLRM